MKRCRFITLFLVLGIGVAMPAFSQEVKPILLYMPDGQLHSRLVEIYVTQDIERDMRPCLRLLRPKEPQKVPPESIEACIANEENWEPIEVISDIQWDHPISDRMVPKRGTLLLFSLDSFRFPSIWPGATVRPVLYWMEPATDESGSAELKNAIGENIYLGNWPRAIIWDLFGMTFALIFLWLLASSKKKVEHPAKALSRYVETSDGYLSLSLLQMALWTLAVGGVVLGFGLVRLRVPDIPGTLVVLMGFSAATGLVGHWQVKRSEKPLLTNEMAGTEETRHSAGLRDLVCIRTREGDLLPSLAKGQMLFWTLLAIILFIYKSIQEGELWEVSEQLVLLMGISQGSFLGRKEIELLKEGKKERGGSKGKQG